MIKTSTIKPREIVARIRDERMLLEEHDPAKIGTISWIAHLADLIHDVPIRDVMVCDIAVEMGAEVLDEYRCEKCGAWKISKPGQDLIMCWLCFTEKTNLQRGITVLTKAKMAAHGVDFDVVPPLAAKPGPTEEGGRNMYGMPL